MTASVNFADTSNFLVGSEQLEITPFFIKQFSIPGVQMSHPAMPTRSGTKLHFGADSIDYDTLDLEILVDANFDTYFELLSKAFQEVDHENDSFAQIEFDLWVLVSDSKKLPRFRVDFRNCRINSIGTLSLSPESELGATFSVSISYDYFTWIREFPKKDSECIPPGALKPSTDKTVKRWNHSKNIQADSLTLSKGESDKSKPIQTKR